MSERCGTRFIFLVSRSESFSRVHQSVVKLKHYSVSYICVLGPSKVISSVFVIILILNCLELISGTWWSQTLSCCHQIYSFYINKQHRRHFSVAEFWPVFIFQLFFLWLAEKSFQIHSRKQQFRKLKKKISAENVLGFFCFFSPSAATSLRQIRSTWICSS